MQTQSAIIIGGGIAGLFAARVLADIYTEVLVIERDVRPEQEGNRAGTPQSFHLHQMLPRGEMIIEGMFPGIMADIRDGGAFSTKDSMILMENSHGTIAFPGDGESYNYSRGLLEWALRQRVHALGNVRFLYHHEVLGLTTSADGLQITGVQIRERGQSAAQSTLAGDLVVEASGRNSKLGQWLDALGYPLAEAERVSADIGYSTCYYAISEQHRGIAVMIVDAEPSKGHYTGGVLKAIEGNQWAVCLSSAGGHHPPIEPAAFLAGFSKLASPAIAGLLRDATPLAEPRGYRLPECVRQHYERMESWPSGLLVLGDALCSFDPVYGQGMTIAAIQANTMAACLREERGEAGFEQRTMQMMQEAIAPAWWRNTIDDLRWPGVRYSGPEPIGDVALLQRFFDRCLKQTTRKLNRLMSQGDPGPGQMDPSLMNYFLMNWLMLPPSAVVNLATLEQLLADETPAARQAALDELFAGYDKRDAEAVLAAAVPDFSLSFAAPPAAIG